MCDGSSLTPSLCCAGHSRRHSRASRRWFSGVLFGYRIGIRTVWTRTPHTPARPQGDNRYRAPARGVLERARELCYIMVVFVVLSLSVSGALAPLWRSRSWSVRSHRPPRRHLPLHTLSRPTPATYQATRSKDARTPTTDTSENSLRPLGGAQTSREGRPRARPPRILFRSQGTERTIIAR